MALKRVNTVNSSNISSLFPETTPSISSVTVTTGKAYILIGGVSTVTVTGTGFVSGSTMYVDSVVATQTTYASSTSLTADLPTMSAGTYAIYVKNPDGTSAVLANAVTYTTGPVWVTPAGSLGTITLTSPLLATVVATSVAPLTGYTVTAGTLPYGNTLNSVTGIITGGIVGSWPDAPYFTPSTTFNFDITATDTLGLSTTRSFSITYASNVTWVTAANLGSLPSGSNTTINLVATNALYFVATSNLPAGFSLNTTTGIITCSVSTYLVDTVFKFSVAGVDRAGWAVVQEFTLIITLATSFTVEYLVIAGGGGGGGNSLSAGAGAGGMLASTTSVVTGTPITLTVGTGGTLGSQGATGQTGIGCGFVGGDSVFGSITAFGGGGGAGSGGIGGAGGSGGGGNGGGGLGVAGQGNKGANGGGSPGGGGAGAAGTDISGNTSSGGGVGRINNITGTVTNYAGGGGGGGWGGVYGNSGGGAGGGGDGGYCGGSPGTANTGGGGGGGGYNGGNCASGGAGGSGVVMIAYPNAGPDLVSISAGLTTQSWNGSAWVNNAAGVTTPVTNLRFGIKLYRFVSGTGTIQW